MKDFIIRKPDFDLAAPLARHWCDNDAFKTAFFNALSLSFPTGEQFFIDSVKKAVPLLAESEKQELNSWIRGFIGQETFHRKYHETFNAEVLKTGTKDCWDKPVRQWQEAIADEGPTKWLAVTAALEHFTAILSQVVLTDSSFLVGVEERLENLWLWHASEELEHREMALHLYRKIQGTEEMRTETYRMVTRKILVIFWTQLIVNLWYDHSLFKISTWKSAYQFLFGKPGLAKALSKPWGEYLKKDFDPAAIDDSVGENWLKAHSL